jgi:hypothetical protein
MIGQGVEWHPVWMALGLVLIVPSVISVRKMGTFPMLVAALVIPQLVYRVFQEAVLLIAYYEIYLGIEAEWHHLTRKEGESGVRKWWRRSRSWYDRRAGLHRGQHRLGGHRRVNDPVRWAGAVSAQQTPQTAMNLEQTVIMPVVGTLQKPPSPAAKSERRTLLLNGSGHKTS